MQITNLRNKNIIVYLVFFLIFLTGAILYKDYGVTLDDEFYRKNGELYYNYIKILFSGNDIFTSKNLEALNSQTLAGSDFSNHPNCISRVPIQSLHNYNQVSLHVD